ncbi:MAG: MlaD family protein [Dysgonamonadaceae bacterium]|jgi:phospholipid/cholesterol/gamma-HCH transport system substrate-binding protein|nr:MlaD family protein [Dysgonamonadaceae bacterium]
MKKYFTKELSIAVITLISLGLLYFGLNYLKGANIFKPSNHYYVKISNVTELQKSSSIYVNGFRVGMVNSIDYFNSQDNTIIVMVSLDKKMKIETGSYFELKSGLTSGAYFDLVLNKYVSSYCQVGDTLEGISSAGLMDKLSTSILPGIEKILPRLDSILIGIQYLVSNPALSQSLDQIAATTSNLEKSTRQLNLLLSKDIPPIVSNLDRVSSDFTEVSANLKRIDMNATLTKIDSTIQNLNQMTNQLNSKNNSISLLLNDRALYDHLDSTAVNASNLLLDLKQSPKRYVHFSLFGGK